MAHVDECLYEREMCEGGSFYNELEVSNRLTLVMSNTTSFVRVTVRVVAQCGFPAQSYLGNCDTNPCLNGGTCQPLLGSYKCQCPNSVQFGPNCEKLSEIGKQITHMTQIFMLYTK